MRRFENCDQDDILEVWVNDMKQEFIFIAQVVKLKPSYLKTNVIKNKKCGRNFQRFKTVLKNHRTLYSCAHSLSKEFLHNILNNHFFIRIPLMNCHSLFCLH
ncbi:hypothetical protein RO04_02160 [Aggregatibacter actinomycetemcomitans]|nr:hypothetical protein D18P1_0301565 [Aggregatibacter actinomycetemcomitans serotype f str. D18P1]OZV18628.1 hypothetical protein RO04_02160 [Aggregatibacter actinomycetemcomitans]TYA49128.1 hypothetical protein FXB74_06185 [Aggregatibacter actinomycetemcomitans]